MGWCLARLAVRVTSDTRLLRSQEGAFEEASVTIVFLWGRPHHWSGQEEVVTGIRRSESRLT